MRKRIPKEIRQQVYDKYNGHCAYCGKEIDYKDMQVDHIVPYMWSVYGTKEQREPIENMIKDGSMDGIDNLMPSCRACNFYKGMTDLEGFRDNIKERLQKSCCSTFQTRLAMQYGIMTFNEWDGKFYFEKLEEENDN